jgi:hypothetical protein
MSRTTTGHPLRQRIAKSLFILFCVSSLGVLAACSDDDKGDKKAVNSVPVLASVSPASATVGDAAFTLTATGSGFSVTSAVHWNGTARATTFVSISQLTAAIPATDLATAGTAQVTVVTPAPGGGTSSAVTFAIQSPPASTGTAEGWWRGTSSTGRSVEGLVLGSGEYWLIYGAVNNSAVIAGLAQGNGTSQNGRFTSSNGIDFNFEGAGNSPVTVDATYVEETSLDGAVNYTGTTNALTFTTDYYLEYRFPSQAPPLGEWIATTFSGTSYSGLTEYTEVTIASSGVLTGVSASGCKFAGTIAPSTEANYYNLTITFQGGSCANGTDAVTGIALFELYPRRLTTAAVNSTRTSGYLFVGSGQW